MSHTDGPWQADIGQTPFGEHYATVWTQIPNNDLRWIVAEAANSLGLDAMQSNAHLIAAAPELLEACKAALPELEEFAPGNAMDMVRDAIAKAKGEVS